MNTRHVVTLASVIISNHVCVPTTAVSDEVSNPIRYIRPFISNSDKTTVDAAQLTKGLASVISRLRLLHKFL